MSQFAALLVIITTITGANGNATVEREIPVLSKELCLVKGRLEVSDPTNALGGRGNIQADYESLLKGNNPYGLKLMGDNRRTDWSCHATDTSWEPALFIDIQRTDADPVESHAQKLSDIRSCTSGMDKMAYTVINQEFFKKNNKFPVFLKTRCGWETNGRITIVTPTGEEYEQGSEELND